jgi:hypothetical protein
LVNNYDDSKKCQNTLEKVISEKPSQSIRKASQIVEILCSLTRLVLKNDLGLKLYKKPDLHEIETNDYPNTYGHHINKTILVLKNC